MKFRFTRWYNRKTGRKGGLEWVCGSDGGQVPGAPWSRADNRADGVATGSGLRSTAMGRGSFPSVVERRALVYYRAILGGQGAARIREDGTVVRRGVSEKTRERLTTRNERRLAAEVLTGRVQHFTKGVILGSRAFIAGWFAQHRSIVTGRSRNAAPNHSADPPCVDYTRSAP